MMAAGTPDLTADTTPDLVTEMFGRLTSSMAALTNRILGADRSVEAVLLLNERMIDIADLAMAEMGKVTPSPRPIACQTGCSHCCRLPEPLTDVPTVIGLSYGLMASLDIDHYRRVHARLANAPRPGCPLLEADRCILHAARPLVCRAFNAYDIGNCARGLFIDGARGTGIELGDLWPMGICAALQDGLAQGLKALGLDAHQVRLAPALHRIVQQRDAVSRWLAGEPVFADLISQQGE